VSRVIVSRGERVFECHPTKEGFICRACGFGKLGRRPVVGASCGQCGARIEEVIIEDRRLVSRRRSL
jgi:bacterioferritin-associated ferredoxin